MKSFFVLGFLLTTLFLIRVSMGFSEAYSQWEVSESLYGSLVSVEGVVTKMAQQGEMINYTLDVSRVNEVNLYGRVYFRVPADSVPVTTGLNSEIKVLGVWRPSKYTFSIVSEKRILAELSEAKIDAVLTTIDTSTKFSGIFISLQESLVEHIEMFLSLPHSAILAGVVFGIELALEDDFYELLRQAGILHIIVASGFNILVVIKTTAFLAKLVSTKYDWMIIMFFVVLYCGLSGFQIPILRAAIMGGGQIWSELRGDSKGGLWWLFISASVLLLLRPIWLIEASFQLSFAASLAIMTLNPFFEKKFSFLPVFFKESFVTTLAVSIFTLPIVWFHFDTLSLLGLLINPLVLQVVPVIMFLGGLTTGISYLMPFFSTILGYGCWLLIEYIFIVIRIFAT